MKAIMVVLFLAISSAAGASEQVKLDAVSVHLFYERSGQLSPDITNIREFGTHNFHPFGEGVPDEEIFHSFLIKLSFSAPKETFEPGLVATLRLTNDEKKVILKREIRSLYIPESGRINKGLWVEGHECEMLTLEVTDNGQTVTKRLPFHCGE